MSYPILYESNATDFFSLGLGTLPDAISPLVTEERNGEFVLDMTYPLHGIRANQIKNNRIIKVDAGHKLTDQRFVIKTVAPTMDNSGNTVITVHAEHVSYLANDLAIKPQVAMTDVNAEQALNMWNSSLTTPNQFTVDSDITTHNSTSWSIDKVENARQALGGVEGSILDVWGGEYRFDNLHISLLQHRGTTANTLLAYGRNLTTFEQEESILETYTSVYPYALLTPAGSDSESKIYTIDGLIIDSIHAANFPNRKVLPVDFSSQFENVKVGTKPSDDDADKTSTYLSLAQVQSKLKEFAQSYITTNNVGVPKVSIKVSFVDLANTVNYADVAPLEELDLCDEVPIRFSKLGIDTTAKISRVVWNVLTDSYDSLELGEISATLGDKLTEIEQTANKAQDTADKANIVQVGADGKSTVFRGQDTPTANHIGDLWYKPNGEDTEMYQWDGVSWHFVMSTKDTHDISDKVDQAMQEMADKEKEINGKLESNKIDISQAQKDLEQVKQDTANQLADIRDSVVKDVADAKAQSKDALDKANSVDDKASQALENATEAKETATTVATDMDTVKGEISSKADKSTVDTINQTVSDQGTKITQNANDIKSKASSSDVDKLSGRVSTAETTLLQTAQGLTGKADTTQLNKLSGDLTTLSNNFSTTSAGFNASLSKIDDKVNSNKEETDSALQVAKADIKATADNLSTNYTKITDEHDYVNSQIKESADKINLSVASVSDKVDEMQIGGRNYIENSKPDSQSGWFFSSGGTNDYKVVDGQYIEITRTGGSYHQVNRQYQKYKNGWYSEIRPGDRFAISMDVSMTTVPTVNSNIYSQLRLNAGDVFNSIHQGHWNLKDIIKKANTWYRVSAVTDIPDNWETDFTKATMARFLIQSQSGSDTDVIRIRNIQLEKGNKATNYKPSDADTDSKIAALQIVDDQIKTSVSNKADTSYVDQKANAITQTVGKNKTDTDNAISKVDQKADSIKSTVASKADASQITQLSNQINLKVSQTDFDNMQVGGRNYVTNGNFANGTNGWTKFGNIDTYQIWGDGRLVYSSTKAINGYTGAGQNNIPISGSKGDNTTVSFDACYFGGNPSNYAKYINIIVHYNDNSGTIVSQSKNSIDMTGSVQRYSFTIKAPTDFSTVNVRFVYDSNTLYRNKLGRVKIEKGTKATDYSDSPDDKADKANLVSQINIDKSGVLIQGKKIMIDGDATIKNAVIKSSMIDTLDASKITTGTLNAANVNVINLNANNITTGTLRGTNLSMNLNTGEVLFQKGSIKSTNGNLNIDIDSGDMAVVNSSGNGFRFEDGKLYLTSNTWIDSLQSKPDYGYIAYKPNFLSNIEGMQIVGTEGIAISTGDYDSYEFFWPNPRPESGAALSLRKNDALLNARDQVHIQGGTRYAENLYLARPTILVGGKNGSNDDTFQEPISDDGGPDIFMKGRKITFQGGSTAFSNLILGDDKTSGYIASKTIYQRTYSNSPNMFITDHGTLGRSTSASKYKLDISDVHNLTEKAQSFLAVKPKQWFDKQETQDFADKLMGNDIIQESPTVNPHAGFIAEDLAVAGLNEFISYGADGSLEGIQYDRLPILHHELLRQAYNKIDYLMTQLNIMDKKISKLEGEN